MPTVQDTIYPRLKAVVAPQDLERVGLVLRNVTPGAK